MMDATAIRRKQPARPTRLAQINPLPYTTNLVMGCDIFAVALDGYRECDPVEVENL